MHKLLARWHARRNLQAEIAVVGVGSAVGNTGSTSRTYDELNSQKGLISHDRPGRPGELRLKLGNQIGKPLRVRFLAGHGVTNGNQLRVCSENPLPQFCDLGLTRSDHLTMRR